MISFFVMFIILLIDFKGDNVAILVGLHCYGADIHGAVCFVGKGAQKYASVVGQFNQLQGVLLAVYRYAPRQPSLRV